MADDLFTPIEWLKRAESSFTIGTAFSMDNLPENVYIDDLCFELQQSAEKAVKAILVKYGIRFPKTHDISDLLKLLKKETTVPIPPEIIPVVRLTRHAIESRYPNWNIISIEEYKQAVEITKITLNWAKNLINEI